MAIDYDIKAGGVLDSHLIAFFDNLLQGVKNMCHTNPGFVIATTTTKIKITNATDYTIDGVFYTKAATDNITFTATTVQAVSTFCIYLASLDSAGALTMTKGADAFTAAEAKLPQLPASNSPIGYVRVDTDASTTFTGGTTALNASGITDTFVNLSVLNSGNNTLARTNK